MSSFAHTDFTGGEAPFVKTSGSISNGQLVTQSGVASVYLTPSRVISEPSTVHAFNISTVNFSATSGGSYGSASLTYETVDAGNIVRNFTLTNSMISYGDAAPSNPIKNVVFSLGGSSAKADWLGVNYKVVLTRPDHTSINNGIPNGSADATVGCSPISLRYGEKRESIVDMDMNTPNGSLSLTRTYRQFYQDTLRFMGMGWSHNHYARVKNHGSGKIFIIMPDGGEIILQETAPGGQYYRGLPGLSAELFWYYGTTNPELLFELTFADGNRYWFGTNLKITRHIHPTGGEWRYEYETNPNSPNIGLLKRVYDIQGTQPFGNELRFRYYSGLVTPYGFKNGLLWRVGDHTSTNLTSANPGGRYVQYDYNRAWQGSGEGVLTSVRDVMGQVWQYEYDSPMPWRGTQIAPIKQYRSPSVSAPSNNFTATPIILKNLFYAWRNGNADQGVRSITQSLGQEVAQPNSPYQIVEQYEFLNNTSNTPTTEVIIGGKTTTHKFDYGVYAGADDAENNSETQQLNGYYQVSGLTNGNGDVTALDWTINGMFLSQATNAEGKVTRFEYSGGDSVNGKLIETEDATGTITKYYYTDTSALRQPSVIRVYRVSGSNVNVFYKEVHFSYNSLGAKEREVEFDVAVSPVAWQSNFNNYAQNERDAVVRRVDYLYVADIANKNYRMLESVIVNDVKTPANNQTTTYAYDNWGRVTRAQQSSMQGGCQFSHSFYDAAGNVLATVCGTSDLPANSTIQSIQSIYDPANPDKYRVTIYEYDTMGRRIVERTNVGSTIDAQVKYLYYDALSRLQRVVTNVQPATTAWASVGSWDWSNVNCGARQDQNLVEYYEYNELNKMRLKRDALGRTTLYSYGGAGRLQRVIENASNPTYFNGITDGITYRIDMSVYNESSDPDLDIETEYNYDGAGNVKRVKRIRQAGTTDFETISEYELDRLGRINEEIINPIPAVAPEDPAYAAYLLELAKPDHYIVSAKYFDEIGRVARTRRSFDLYPWVTQGLYSQYRSTLYGFDPLSRMVRTIESASDPNYVTQTTPDNQTLSNYPTGGVPPSTDGDLDVISQVRYDPAGRKLYETDALGQKTWYGYDGLGRVIRTVKNAVGTAEDMSAADPRNTAYVLSSAPDQDLVTNTFYNPDGQVQRVQEIKDPANLNAYWTLFQYDVKGRVTREIRNAVNSAYYGGSWSNLSAYGALSTDSDKDIAITTVYDSLGRVSTVTDEKTGNTSYTGYDSMGRTVITVKNYAASYVGQTPTDPINWVWNSSLSRWENGAGVPISHGAKNDQNLISTTTYDRVGRVIATRDSAGGETRLTLDQAGRVTKVVENYVDGVYSSTNPDQDRITLNTYHKAGYLLTTTDPRGTVTKHEYDKVGRRIKTTTAYGTALATTSYTCYNKVGEVLRVIQNYVNTGSLDPDKRTAPTTWEFNPTTHGTDNDQNLITEYRYDKIGRQVQLIDPVGNSASKLLNKAGLVVSQTDALSIETVFRYDKLRRLTIVVQGYLTQGTTDPANWIWDAGQARWEDGANNAITFGTDGARNLIAQIAYDKAGRMVSRREPRGNLTQYTYDNLDRRRTLVNPLNITWETQYGYLSDGRTRVMQIYPGLNGSTTPYTVQREFDHAGRIGFVIYNDANVTPNLGINYTLAGRRSVMIEYNGNTPLRTTEYTYDAAQRPTQIRFDVDGNNTYDHVVQYAYDPLGLRTQVKVVSDGNRTIDYVYDAKGRTTGLTHQSGGVTKTASAAYDAASRLKGMTRDTTLKTAYAYDPVSRLTQIRHRYEPVSGSPVTLAQFDYSVNALGNRTQALEQWRPNPTDPMVERTINYAYDSASRLTGATYFPNLTGTAPALHTYGYTYDRSGNRLTETLNAVTRTFGYNQANQLVTQGSTTLAYDRNGNLLSDGTNTHVWDRANRLKSMGGVSYTYDGDGDRTWRVANGQATLYMLDKQAPLTVVLNEQNGNNFIRYVHGPTGILAQQNPDNTMRWMLQDGLQSVRAISDGTNVLSAQAYSPYGEPMFTDMPTEFGFTGEQTDSLNDLVYLRARYLNPKLGIFGSLDAFEGRASSPLTMNGYGWVEGNVANRRDITGKQSCPGESSIYVQQACTDFSQALASLGNTQYWDPITSSMSNGMVSIPTLETTLESLTGTQLLAYNSGELNSAVDCSAVADVPQPGRTTTTELIKRSMLNWSTSLMYTADYLSRFGVTNDKAISWMKGDTVEFLSNRPRITLDAYTGFVKLDPLNRVINLGGAVSIGTNVHEQGHDFDRFYDFRASAPLEGLYIDRYTLFPSYDSTLGAAQPTQNSNGLLGRAGRDNSQQELWADMHMTTVGEGNNFLSGPSGETAVGWDYTWARDAKFKRAYTLLTTNALLNGSSRFPPINPTPEESLAWVTWVARLAYNNPGNPGGDY